MSPLLLESEDEWRAFEESLKAAKKAGVDSVSSDVWLGLVQPDSPEKFNWAYYRRQAASIRKAGLKWIPILSTHACGGNVGDAVNIPLPEWIWKKGGPFVSEAHNRNLDYVQFWDTPKVLPYYRNFYGEFKKAFAVEADNIHEVIVSLGPSGEIHYPSYHHHDARVPFAHYPHRGALQASSEAAKESFRAAMLEKYGSVKGIGNAWGQFFTRPEQIEPPSGSHAQRLFESGLDSQYARDLFEWYRESMLKHMRQVLGTASKVFKDGPMSKAMLGMKIPGIHWRMDTRVAELTGGMLSLNEKAEWESIEKGMGYRRIFEELESLERPMDIHVYFTAGGIPNGNDDKMAASRAEDLADAVSKLSKRHLPGSGVGIENALAPDLHTPARVNLFVDLVDDGKYSTVSLLRMDDVLKGPMVNAIAEMKDSRPGVPKRFKKRSCVLNKIDI